jgi:hypothetical protein
MNIPVFSLFRNCYHPVQNVDYWDKQNNNFAISFYGCKCDLLLLREVHKLHMFKNKVHWEMFWSKKDQ